MNKQEIIQLIKFLRPKYYNRLTGLIVGSGLVLISPPLLTSLLHIFIKEITQKNLISSYDTLWGFLLILTGLTYNVVVSQKMNKPTSSSSNTVINKNTYNINYFLNKVKTSNKKKAVKNKLQKPQGSDYAYVKIYNTLMGNGNSYMG